MYPAAFSRSTRLYPRRPRTASPSVACHKTSEAAHRPALHQRPRTAIVVWRQRDNSADYDPERCKYDRWEVVVPELVFARSGTLFVRLGTHASPAAARAAERTLSGRQLPLQVRRARLVRVDRLRRPSAPQARR